MLIRHCHGRKGLRFVSLHTTGTFAIKSQRFAYRLGRLYLSATSMRPLSRIVHALFAVWFAIVIGDPGVLHACPMHGGHGTSHQAAAAVPDSAHEHAGHGTSSTAQASHDASVPDAGAPCTCVGHCSAAPAALPLPVSGTVQVSDVAAEVRRPAAAPVAVAPAAPALRLPFANGPPTA